MDSPFPWKFLSDEAIDQTGSDSFGVHSTYAELLLQIAKTAATPFSIALYSIWGTGKTSVARILQSLAAKEADISVVYLDVWKYSSDPLKRWILLESERQLRDQNILVDYKYQERNLQSHLEFEQQIEDETKVRLDRRVLIILGAILLAAVLVIVSFSLFAPQSWKSNGVIGGLILVLSGVGFTALVLTSVFGELLKSISGMVFKRTVRQTTAKPAFSSEKFSEIFRDLVQKATKGKSRLLFVFDNLDRCSEEVAVEAIGVIKTYLDEPNCVYLIPCDEGALIRHISKGYSSSQADSEGNAREFLNKFFQVTMRLPAASSIDIDKFMDEQLAAAQMTDLKAEAHDVLVLGYLGQTPRQIKRVINDLIAFRALAIRAEESGLIASKSLTGDLPLLTKMSVIWTQWPDFLAKLSDDPELWSEMTDKANSRAAVEPGDALLSFLRATRHVATNSDVRPFIYLKQFDFERDTALSRVVEEYLRKGEAAKYEELLKQEQSPVRLGAIVEKTLATVNQWLPAKRRIFLTNAAPLLVKAALLIPERRELKLLALEVLEDLAQVLPLEEFEQVVNVKDILDLDSEAMTPQKRTVLDVMVGLFSLEFGAAPSRQQEWRAILTQHSQLSYRQKSTIAELVNQRYSTKTGAEAALEIVGVGKNQPDAFEWLVDKRLLKQIVDSVEFSGVPLDETRIETLVAYQDQLTNTNREALAQKIAELAAASARTTFDSLAQVAIAALVRFKPTIFRPEEILLLATNLLSQVTRSALSLKADWLRPLLHLYPVLPKDVRDSLEEHLFQIVANPPDPTALATFLEGISPEDRQKLLSVEKVKAAIHLQPQYLEASAKRNASTQRELILDCFVPTDLMVSPELFDESREWDLAIFVGVIRRAAAIPGADLADVRRRLIEFCNKHIVENLPSARGLYDTVCEAINDEPKLMDVELASVLAGSTIDLFDSELDSYYKWFQFWKKELKADKRTELMRQAAGRFLSNRQDQWLQVLQLLSSDVVGDEEVRRDQQFIKELFDYAFAAAEEEPLEGVKPILELFPYLAAKHLRDYVDRALDTLITYEAAKQPLGRLEPFLEMIETPASKLIEGDIQKAARFARRMLGPANEPEEQKRILRFIDTMKRVELVSELRSELEQLASSENEEIAASAKALVSQVTP